MQRSPKKAGSSFTYSLTSQVSPLKDFLCVVKSCEVMHFLFKLFFLLFFVWISFLTLTRIYYCFQAYTYDFILVCKKFSQIEFYKRFTGSNFILLGEIIWGLPQRDCNPNSLGQTFSVSFLKHFLGKPVVELFPGLSL